MNFISALGIYFGIMTLAWAGGPTVDHSGGATPSGISRAESRAEADGILERIRLKKTRNEDVSGDLQTLARLLRSYRIDADSSQPKIYEAPIVGLLLKKELPGLWDNFRAQAHDQELQKILNPIPLDLLLDGAMQMVVSGTLPDSLKDKLSVIDSDLAKKVLIDCWRELPKLKLCRSPN